MKDILQETIRVLKEKVNGNLEIIKENQKSIKEILKEPYSEDRSQRLKARYDKNKTMLMENNDFINVQLTLINFIDKYKNSSVMGPNQIETRVMAGEPVDFFTATINGEIPFNSQHPMFEDSEFFEKLLTYYQKREEYEMCDKLIRSKND